MSIECDREAPSWEIMARNEIERTGGGGSFVGKPRVVKQEGTGTDSYGVCALKLQGWHWFRIALKGELYNFDIGNVKLLAY